MNFKAQSCTRIDFAGGTLDLWPLYRLIPGCQTVNASINCYTEAEFTPGDTLNINVLSADFDESYSFKTYDAFMNSDDGKLSLLQAVSTVLDDSSLFTGTWKVSSQSPAGSGLGGSSSILITLLKVVLQLKKGLNFSEEELITIARDLESSVLKTPAGIQDYFSPLKKGINVIKYEPTGFKRETLDEVASFWKERILIVDSEIKHHSGFNNWQILKGFVDGDSTVVSALNQIAQVSLDTEVALREKDVERLSDCFFKELEARKKVSNEYVTAGLSKFMTSLESIDEVKSLKICGAGGGGCLIVLFSPENRKSLIEKLSKEKVSVLPFELEI